MIGKCDSKDSLDGKHYEIIQRVAQKETKKNRMIEMGTCKWCGKTKEYEPIDENVWNDTFKIGQNLGKYPEIVMMWGEDRKGSRRFGRR